MVNSNPASPAHFGFAGNFSADDIQELLGAMVAEHQRSPTRSTVDEVDDEGTDRASVDRTTDDVEDGAKAQARSERKRSREKQRRSDVNRQFADLTALLKQIEAEEAEEDNTVARLAFSPTNRVDMIARTITHLERLRAINKRRKLEVETLQQQLEQAKKAGEDTAAKLKEVMFNQPAQHKQVMMMVPMMLPADGSSSYGGAASMPMMNPFMMPQPFMMPPMAQAPAPGQQAVQQPNLAQSQYPGYAVAPQAQVQQPQQPAPLNQATSLNSSSQPLSNHSNTNSATGTSQTPSQTNYTHGTQPVPIMPAGAFPTSASVNTMGGQYPVIAPNPMSFFMPQQSFMAANSLHMMTPSPAPSTNMGPSTDSASSPTDPVPNPSANNRDSKSPPAGQSGVQGGSNLAHCA